MSNKGATDAKLKPYQLEGSDRVELISDSMAMARNLSRSDTRKWVPANTTTGAIPPPIPVGEERAAAMRRGLAKDRESAAQTQPNPPDMTGEGIDEMGKKVKKTNKGGKTSLKRGESKRPKWHGLGVIKLITHMGSLNGKGKEYFSVKRAMKIIRSAGLDTTENTINAYLGDGKRGLGVVEFNREQTAAFRELANKHPAGPDDGPKRTPTNLKKKGKNKGNDKKKDGKKSTSGKKANKKGKSSTAESAPTDDELAAAQAEADASDEDFED